MKLISDYNYIGPSMQPLFLPGDGIIIDSDVEFPALIPGDIICYPKPDEPAITVVHRIVGFKDGGAITRGDNNSAVDPYIITAAMNPQLVVKIKRGSRTIKVANGRIGMLVHRKNLIARQFRRNLFPLIRALCLLVANLGILYRLKLYDKKLTFRTFKRQQREDEFMILNNRRIGHRADDGSWHIRFPWRFFINPNQMRPEGGCGFKLSNCIATDVGKNLKSCSKMAGVCDPSLISSDKFSSIFSKYHQLLRLFWFGIITAVIFFIFYPVNTGLVRLFLVTSIPIIFGGATILLWHHKKIRLIPAILLIVCLLPFLLPGKKVNRQILINRYVNNLSKYDGVPYVWGGEKFLGIDCSGLVRKGMINANLYEGICSLNPSCLRKAVELWWFDCSAKALMNNYRDFTQLRFKAESINKLDHSRLDPGDFAVTVDGVHTLVYLGNSQWIEADPGIGKVIIAIVPVNNNGWFDVPVKILKWK